ncbi:MAG: RIP metalloprotease RseP [Desulfobacterales bacterium]
MSYILSLIIVLGVLIFFHELGHFLAAKLCGVGVEKFSLGFGPRLFGRKIGMTDYRISAIPLGGYVKMVGEEPDSELRPEEVPLSFTHKHVFKRILIVAAGPLFNVLLAVLIFFVFLQIYGAVELEPVVGSVVEESPAMEAGIREGDRIIAVNGSSVNTFSDMSEHIMLSGGESIRITILRGQTEKEITLTPQLKKEEIFGETIERYLIGIQSSGEHIRTKQYNPIEAFSQSLVQTYNVGKLMIVGIVQLIRGEISTKTLGGPILIAQMAGDQAKQGVPNLIYFIAFISINLAIINLMPIPVLDGGHLMFFFIEAVIKRPVSIKMREIAQQVGIFLLLLLMVFVFYNDISRLLEQFGVIGDG